MYGKLGLSGSIKLQMCEKSVKDFKHVIPAAKNFNSNNGNAILHITDEDIVALKQQIEQNKQMIDNYNKQLIASFKL